MTKTRLFVALLMMTAVMMANAKPALTLVNINGVELECRVLKGKIVLAIVPQEHNSDFLKGVFCGDSDELTKANVNITDWEDTPNYTAAIVTVDLKDADTQYYLVTYKPKGGIIDGALMLRKNDISITENTIEKVRMTPKEHEITLEKNVVTVSRNFESIVDTGNGGPRVSEEGKVTMRFDIDKSGRITRPADGVTQQSTWVVKPNMSIPGNRHDNIEVTESDNCRTIGMGLNVIKFYTQPASDEKIPEALEEILTLYYSYLMADEMLVKNEARKCVLALKDWQKRLIYRNPQPWLTWLSNNCNGKSMELLKKNLDSDEDFNSWFRNEVKNQGNKKLKKAWEKLLK
ncbi:MAG: hypothetical protein IKW83_04065 [Muribaculaceae bacterium]|nr:hypothetical protein [Muribaculaceae bacterium]